MNATVGKTALGAMAVTLSFVLMLPTALDWFVYALPFLAGFLTMFCVIELGKSWAFGAYATTALLSVLFLPNKEAAVMYAAFFGYYPIIKALLEGSRIPRAVEYIAKFAVFNAAMITSYFLLTKLLGLSFNAMMGIAGDAAWAKYAVPIFLGIGNVFFLIMDIGMTLNATVYLHRLQPKLHKMMRFKP